MMKGLRFRNLQHQIAFWPVLCAAIIMIAGGLIIYSLATSGVQQYREAEFQNFADVLKGDLEAELQHVYDDLGDWAKQWGEISKNQWLEPTAKPQVRALATAAISLKPAQTKRYDLVLFIDQRGRTLVAHSSPYASQAARLVSTDQVFDAEAIRQLLELPQDWIAGLMRERTPRATSVRRLARLNTLLLGNDSPSSWQEIAAYHHFVIAVPAMPGGPEGGTPAGAVIGVVSWTPFQSLLDGVEQQITNLHFRNGYPYLADSDSDLIIGHKYRNPAVPTENFYQKRLKTDFPQGEYPHTLPALVAELERTKPESRKVFNYVFKQDKFAALRAIAPPDPSLSMLSWRLGVGVDEPEVFAPFDGLKWLFVLIVLLAAAATFLAAYLIGRQLSVSVRDLTRMTRDAADGKANFVKAAKSQAEISELQDAISDYAVRMRQDIRFESIPNPYVAGLPIRQAEMFFGRHEDLEWVGNHLRQPGNELLLLVGQRRIGKTSLLRHIARNRAELNIVPFFLDTQLFLQKITSDASFYRVILEEMLGQLHEAAPLLPKPTLGDLQLPETFTRFIKFLNNQMTALPVCLFDEFDNLDIKFRDRSVSTDVIAFLGGLLESTRRLSIIATGSADDHQRRAKYWNALTLKSQPRKLGVLSETDGRRMIVDPLRGRVAYDTDIPERILRFTGCHPYYTQDFCQRIVTELNARSITRVSAKVVDVVTAQVLQDPPPTLDHFWDSLKWPSRIAIAALACVLDSEQEQSTMEAAYRTLPRMPMEEIESRRVMLAGGISWLVNTHWLLKEGDEYKFRIDLLRQWLRREHPVAQLEYELTSTGLHGEPI